MTGVYKITNLKNGDFYIGSSKDIGYRWKQHLYLYQKSGRHYEYHLYKAFRAYGIENFEFSIIELCDEQDRVQLEQKYCDELRPKYNEIQPEENPMECKSVKEKHKKRCKQSWGERGAESKEKSLNNLRKGRGSAAFLSHQFEPKKVKAIKISDGTEILFDSLNDASRSLDIPKSSISQILNPNHIRKQSKGFRFEFATKN